MAGRRTNLALLILLSAAFVTGGVAYGLGTGWGRWVVVAHGIVAFAMLLLAPWKSVIARRGIRRRRRGRNTSLVFSLLISIALLFGIFHSTGIARSLGFVSAMQVHVGAALLTIPLAGWHVVARRVRLHRTDLSRRQLLRSGALLGGAGATYLAIEGIARVAGLPGARRRFTGSYEQGSYSPDEMPVTQWLNDRVPSIEISTWRLHVSGGPDPRSWTYEELGSFDDRIEAVIDCTGGWFAAQEWSGVVMSRLVRVPPGARSVLVRSTTGYARRFSIEMLDRMLLAISVDGRPLSSGHGFPARVVVPGKRGFWWVKWVERVEVSDIPAWLQLPFPLS